MFSHLHHELPHSQAYLHPHTHTHRFTCIFAHIQPNPFTKDHIHKQIMHPQHTDSHVDSHTFNKMHSRTHTFTNILAPKHAYSHVDLNTYTCVGTPTFTSIVAPKPHRFTCSFSHIQRNPFTNIHIHKHMSTQATQILMQTRTTSS